MKGLNRVQLIYKPSCEPTGYPELSERETRLKILFLAAEAAPFVKVGGLGDVAGSLPRALLEQGGADIRVAIPFYGEVQRLSLPLQTVARFEIPHAAGAIQATAFATQFNGIPFYFISGAPIPPEAPVYSQDNLADGRKFTFFSLAALELARQLDWQPDILHANDWHTAPAVYALFIQRDPFFQSTATVLGVHNLPYLGVGAGPAMAEFGLPAAQNSPLPWWAQDMPLPLGLLSADQIVVASPTYAREILTPEFGVGLDGFLASRQERLCGILNGIDTEAWDPETDAAIPVRYNASNPALRKENKRSLLNELGFEPDPETILLGVVSRLDAQKGIDLIPAALKRLSDAPWRAIFLASGDPALEESLRSLQAEFPNRVRAALRFDAALSRRIYAGADLLLIPSRYEPCGLTQMIAMRYGCVPLARATGGLRDTIQDFHAGKDGTGFLFEKPDAEELAAATQRALTVYADRDAWSALQQRGMRQDFSWSRSARQYLELYQRLRLQRREKASAGDSPRSPRKEGVRARQKKNRGSR